MKKMVYCRTRGDAGKPLVMIAGKPMIVRTYEQAKQAKKLDKLVVRRRCK